MLACSLNEGILQGAVLIATAEPKKEGRYAVSYELRTPFKSINPVAISSPMKGPISQIVDGLPDIGSSRDNLGKPVSGIKNPTTFAFEWSRGKSAIQQGPTEFNKLFSTRPYAQWSKNIQVYERMGDFRDKCIHDGTNLAGPKRHLASEFVLIRAYRASLIMLGRVADPEMYRGGNGDLRSLVSDSGLAYDPKPGVYAAFLSAYIAGIDVYKLGLDKVHSDYGGVPMKLAPGSRLETGREPLADSSRFNQALAEIAFAFYATPTGSTLPAIRTLSE